MRYDYSLQHNMQHVLLGFIYGVRGERSVPVNKRRIIQFFSGTSESFVISQLNSLLDKGYVVITRTSLNRKRSGYAYEMTDKGKSLFERERFYRSSKG